MSTGSSLRGGFKIGGPIIPSLKIKGKHNLNRIIRDTHAGYSLKPTVPLTKSTEQLSKESSVNVTYKKYMGKRQGYYRYYYYKTYTQKKPEKTLVIGFPVFMQRKHKWEKEP